MHEAPPSTATVSAERTNHRYISRVPGGWLVRVYKDPAGAMSFTDGTLGGEDATYRIAQDYRDWRLRETQAQRENPPRATTSSNPDLPRGVRESRDKRNGKLVGYEAYWSPQRNKQTHLYFSFHDYGVHGALQAAIEARQQGEAKAQAARIAGTKRARARRP